MPRAQTIEFALIEPPRRDSNTGNPLGVNMDRTATVDRRELLHRKYECDHCADVKPESRRSSLRIHPTTSVHSDRTPQRSQHKNYGGFPLPHVLAGRLFTWLFPNAGRALVRSVTLDRGGGVGLGPRYFSFEVPVGHNSAFPLLTNEQLEELGGVEYRALNALLCIVAGVRLSLLPCQYTCSPPDSIILDRSSSATSSSRHTSRRANTSRISSLLRCIGWFLLPGMCLARLLYRALRHHQVLSIPSCICIHKYGHVARRPIDGALPRGIRPDLPHHLPCPCW
jgi:hypothetical protein